MSEKTPIQQVREALEAAHHYLALTPHSPAIRAALALLPAMEQENAAAADRIQKLQIALLEQMELVGDKDARIAELEAERRTCDALGQAAMRGKAAAEHAVARLVADRDRYKAQAERMEAAFEKVTIGGNHLASALIQWLGAADSEFPPYGTPHAEAEATILAHGHDTNYYDCWCCWKAIMEARDSLADAPESAGPKCAKCGYPRGRHRSESVAHHSECTLEQYVPEPPR